MEHIHISQYRFLTLSRRASYAVLSPDFARCEFDETDEFIHAKDVVLYGFDQVAVYQYEINGKNHSYAKRVAFKYLFDDLIRKMYSVGATYILLENKIIQCSTPSPTQGIVSFGRYRFVVE